MKPPSSADAGPPIPPERDRFPDCAAAIASLQRRLDRELLTESPDVLLHRVNCPDCSSLEAAARRLEEGMRQTRLPAPPADLTDRILERMKAEPVRNRRRQRIAVAGMALAASVLIAAVAINPWQEPAKQIAALVTHQPAAPESEKQPNAERAVIAQTGTDTASLEGDQPAVRSFAKKSSDETHKMNLPSAEMARSVGSFDQLEPAAASIDEAGNSAMFGIAPITKSARRAADMFWREVGPDAGRQPIQ